MVQLKAMECPIAPNKELENEGRGYYHHHCDVNSTVNLIKWYENKCVNLSSAFSPVASAGTVNQWDAKKSYTDVSLPEWS